MADEKLPYLNAYGVITKVLEKVKAAATPDRFTQDFLATKLGMKGGNAKMVIPYLKRIGFIGSDGIPTERYKKFRNPTASGRAAAEALKQGYKPLFERNENAQGLKDSDLKGLVVEATGAEPDGSTVRAIMGSYKALKSFANFDELEDEPEEEVEIEDESDRQQNGANGTNHSTEQHHNAIVGTKLGLSYTINLNLPSTSDIAVFNAIFRSLKESLLK